MPELSEPFCCIMEKGNSIMSNRRLTTIGIVMPADFAVAPYEAIHARITATLPTTHRAWSHYAGGWNALAYRFRACAEHDTAFTLSLRRAGKAPRPNERYVQERELFSFFGTGLSAIESLCYSLFAIGSMLNLKEFNLIEPGHLKAINPKKTTEQFSKVFPNEAITTNLAGMISDANYEEWCDIRNILAHRSAPGRHFTRSIPPQPLDEQVLWGEWAIPIDETTTRTRRAWLATTLRNLLSVTDAFTTHHFPA
jgi:hypothetical protein